MVEKLLKMEVGKYGIDVLDYIAIGKRISLVELVGPIQICRSVGAFLLSGNKSEAFYIGDNVFFAKDASYTRTEETIKEGYSHALIYQRDLLDCGEIFFSKSTSDEDYQAGFDTWAEKLPIPIPREKDFRAFLFERMCDTNLIQKKVSENSVYHYAQVNIEALERDDYNMLAEYVEDSFMYLQESSSKESNKNFNRKVA